MNAEKIFVVSSISLIMDLGTYLKWNFIIGGVLLVLLLFGSLALNNLLFAGAVVLVLAVVAYRYYRKVAYFEGYDD